MAERSPPRAFVIEDDLHTLALLTDLAAMCGFEPVAFTRLSSARAALRERVPTIMVVDDDLPDGRGSDLVSEVRANPRTSHVRVVFCTAAEPDAPTRDLTPGAGDREALPGTRRGTRAARGRVPLSLLRGARAAYPLALTWRRPISPPWS